ncbi:XshC-Cox1 family protein [Emticicia sp. ODNR4P]|nr:XshC-Cox1 family protein [Emticicia sp. ODNR4P]
MKEIKAIVEAYLKMDFETHSAALATVVRVEGSSYRRAGARMLVSDSGEWIGGISGGCLEGDALKRARLAMAQGKSTIVTYDTTDDDPYQIGVGLGCNGIIDVLLTPIDPNDSSNPVAILSDILDKRVPTVVVTVTATDIPEQLPLGAVYKFDNGRFAVEFPVNEIHDEVTKAVEGALFSEKSSSYHFTLDSGAELSLFVEVILPATHILIYGGNYDIYPMVQLSKEVGWKVSVVCNPLKVHKRLFDWADHVIAKEDAETVEIDAYTVAVLMAHDYETDFRNMRNLVATPIKYIGMLGPKKRTDKMFTKMEEEGSPISPEDLARIATPVGLDIGASTPEEIAISIIAEIRAMFAGRSGQRLRLRDKPIYES